MLQKANKNATKDDDENPKLAQTKMDIVIQSCLDHIDSPTLEDLKKEFTSTGTFGSGTTQFVYYFRKRVNILILRKKVHQMLERVSSDAQLSQRFTDVMM